ncbi:hypothetical protein RRF57_013192 [Xylaria bambusicola]|uniref:Uncharacterized protein n=1 Tax=Xylaria bambusicola TaxID=326684 RepID=A0AAN7ZBA9_9PEZI
MTTVMAMMAAKGSALNATGGGGVGAPGADCLGTNNAMQRLRGPGQQKKDSPRKQCADKIVTLNWHTRHY